jgi:hypothetical protein
MLALGEEVPVVGPQNRSMSCSPTPLAAGVRLKMKPPYCRSLFMVGCAAMAPRRLYNFLIDADLAAALKRVKEDTGIPESEQVRRAIREWMERRGTIAKTNRKRAPARKR